MTAADVPRGLRLDPAISCIPALNAWLPEACWVGGQGGRGCLSR